MKSAGPALGINEVMPNAGPGTFHLTATKAKKAKVLLSRIRERTTSTTS
jgi:hypothetical protein